MWLFVTHRGEQCHDSVGAVTVVKNNKNRHCNNGAIQMKPYDKDKNKRTPYLQLIDSFFFFTSVHAEQTATPAKPVTVEAKNETFAPQHPDQYLSWKATSEQSERVDALAEDPRLVILWAGYPFSRDYNKPRGHAFAVTDVRETLRTGAPKNAEDGPLPMACWSCKSPDVARLIQKDGEDGYFHGKWARGGRKSSTT